MARCRNSPLTCSPRRPCGTTAPTRSSRPSASRSTLVDALGQQVDAVTVHKALFVCWAVVTGLHVLARLAPAVMLAGRRSGVPGERRRLAALIITLVAAVVAAILLLGTADSWPHAGHHHATRAAVDQTDRSSD